MTKVLLLASRNGCGASAVTLLAMMSCENLFVMPKDLRAKARKQHELFVDASGDHLTLIRVCTAFLKAEDKHRFCMKHFFSHRALEYAVNVRDQLMEVAKEMGVEVGEEEEDEGKWDRLRQCMAEAWHENVARRIVGGEYRCVEDDTKIFVHPSSFLFMKGKEFIVFSERVKTKRLYARWVSAVDPSLAALDE
jgi:HrpA-like RNA helicase